MGSFYHALTISCICNQQQNTPDSEFLLEKYQSKSLGKFTESSTMLLHRARLRRLHKCIQNTHRKLVLTKVNFGSKFVFKTDLYFIRRSAQIHRITSLSSRSITRSATGSPFKNFRCHTITNNLFFLTRS